jgi:thiamine biosynthesis lipoprotein
MGTIITIEVPTAEGSSAAIDRAFQWFRKVERCCSRFDPESELLRLSRSVEAAVPVSAMLFEAVQFAVGMAEESGGAFDPTVGAAMETRGFNQEYSTKKIVRSAIEPDRSASYRDVLLDPEERTIALLRPLVLDLGAVAKGMAMDLAARELEPLGSFSIDAGGDLFMGGCSPDGSPWRVGIRHPRLDGELIDVIEVSDCAVCTSGDYERRQSEAPDAGHHILDPHQGESSRSLASATVVGPTAMLADAAATAAFVLGPEAGILFLDRLELDGLLISPALDRFATEGMGREYKLGATAIL